MCHNISKFLSKPEKPKSQQRSQRIIVQETTSAELEIRAFHKKSTEIKVPFLNKFTHIQYIIRL